MSTVLAEFLQQFFTLVFTAVVVVLLGGKLTWVLMLFVPVILMSARRIGQRVRSTTRNGQDKLAEIQNILHETITGVRIVKAFSMEAWETRRFRDAARRLFRANLRSVSAAAISSPMMDIFGAIAIALLILMGREYIKHHIFTEGIFLAFIVAVFKLYEPVRKFAQFNNNFQQALGASSAIFDFLDAQDDVREKPVRSRCRPSTRASASSMCTSATSRATTTARCCTTSTWTLRRERWSPSSAPAARARPRWYICCRASSM